MLLTKREIQQAIEQVKTAFPKFTDWEYTDERDGEYIGFSLWGEFSPNPKEFYRHFFITFDIDKNHWHGHVTMGKPSYFWTSTDLGDAHVLDTEPCKTLEDAIIALKKEIANLFEQLGGVPYP